MVSDLTQTRKVGGSIPCCCKFASALEFRFLKLFHDLSFSSSFCSIFYK